MSEAVLFSSACAFTVGVIPSARLQLPQGPGVMGASSSSSLPALAELIHPILGEVTQIIGRMNSPGHVSVSADDKGNSKGWLTRCLTSGRLKLVETRLSLYKKCQGMAAIFFFFFMFSCWKYGNKMCCSFLMTVFPKTRNTRVAICSKFSEVEERRGEKEKIFLIKVNHDRQQGT